MGLLNAFYDRTTHHLTITCLVCGATYGPVCIEDTEIEGGEFTAALQHTADCPVTKVKEKEQN